MKNEIVGIRFVLQTRNRGLFFGLCFNLLENEDLIRNYVSLVE